MFADLGSVPFSKALLASLPRGLVGLCFMKGSNDESVLEIINFAVHIELRCFNALLNRFKAVLCLNQASFIFGGIVHGQSVNSNNLVRKIYKFVKLKLLFRMLSICDL